MIKFYYADPAVYGYGHKVRTEALAAGFGTDAEVWNGNLHFERGVTFFDVPQNAYIPDHGIIHARPHCVCVGVSDNFKQEDYAPAFGLLVNPWGLVRDQFFVNSIQGKLSDVEKTAAVFIGSGETNKKWFVDYAPRISDFFNKVETIWSGSDLSAEGLNAAMRRHPVNIVTAGMMAYESLATGTPTIVVDPARIWDVPEVPTVIDPCNAIKHVLEHGNWPNMRVTGISKTAEKLRWFVKGVEACGR